MRKCPRCSMGDSRVYHAPGDCERDPKLPNNVIAAYFKRQNGAYVGIVWEAIANHAIRALDEAGYKVIKRREAKSATQ